MLHNPWVRVPLSEVAKCQGGSAFSPALQGRRQGEIPFYKVSDMNLPQNRWMMARANNYVDLEDGRRIGGDIKPAGSVVFPKVGGAIHTNKKRQLSMPAFIDNNMMAVWSTDRARCLPNFLHAFFLLVPLSDLANPGPLPSINSSRIQALEIDLPPIEEQYRIVAFLEIARRACDSEDSLLTNAEELKRASMQALFTRGLRSLPQKETDIGSVPANWKVAPMGEFAVFQRGFDITKIEQTEGKIPVVSSGGVKSFHDQAGARGPGVLIGRKGSIGLLHFVGTDYWPHDTTLWCRDFLGNVPKFVFYRLHSVDMKRLDSGAANPALNRNFLHKELISWPSPDEQNEIVAILDAIDRKIELHRRKRAVLDELFTALLHKLMTGDIRVTDLDLSALTVEPSSEVAA